MVLHDGRKKKIIYRRDGLYVACLTVWSTKFVSLIIFIAWFPTSEKRLSYTHMWLRLFREILYACSENHLKNIETLCEQNADLLNFEESETRLLPLHFNGLTKNVYMWAAVCAIVPLTLTEAEVMLMLLYVRAISASIFSLETSRRMTDLRLRIISISAFFSRIRVYNLFSFQYGNVFGRNRSLIRENWVPGN